MIRNKLLNVLKRMSAYKGIVLVYALLLLLAEGAGQLAVRYLESKKPSGIEAEELVSYQEPLVGFALRKGLDVSLSHWRVRTDRWGFRGTEQFPREKPANERRIFLLGGSTVFGWGVNEDQSLQDYLRLSVESWKKKNFPQFDLQVRIINAGVPWYASWHEASTLFFRVMEFSPDAVIFLDGLNDTALGIASDWSPIYQGYVDRPTQIAYEKKRQGGEGGIWSILNLSPSLRYFHARLKERQAAKTGTFRPEVWDQYLAIMQRVRSLTETSGVKSHWYYQPVQPIDKPITHYELTHNGTSMADPVFEATFKQQYLEGEKRVLASTLPVESLKSIFKDNKKTIYLDGLHYNSLGNDIIAAAMFKRSVEPWMKQWLAKPTPLAARNAP